MINQRKWNELSTEKNRASERARQVAETLEHTGKALLELLQAEVRLRSEMMLLKELEARLDKAELEWKQRNA